MKRFFNTLLVVFYFTISLVAGFSFGALLRDYQDESKTVYGVTTKTADTPAIAEGNQETTLSKEKHSPAMVSISPEHGETLSYIPDKIEIYFDRVISFGSEIYIKNKRDYGSEETVIGPDEKSMSRDVFNYLPDGLITIDYTVCFKDRSCHQGSYQFFLRRAE